MLQKHWWKILGVLILGYTFIAGMLVPLNSGITSAQPHRFETGENISINITGYNTFYAKEPDKVRAWLKMDNERALGATEVEVIDDRQLVASFSIPPVLPSNEKIQYFTLLVDDPGSGTQVLPDKVAVKQDSIRPDLGASLWNNSSIADLHEMSGMTYPFRNILGETIRNTYYHVPLWFAMILLFIGSMWYSIQYLRKKELSSDIRALNLTRVGILFGILGLVTGAIWAKFTWGQYWSGDIKQNMTAICLLIYFAYFVLRNSFDDPDQRARIAGVYNIFAFVAMIPLLFVIPRLYDSLHPGNGGNPAMGGEDLDNTMRMVFYPAIIGWTLFGLWMANLWYRFQRLEFKLLEEEE